MSPAQMLELSEAMAEDLSEDVNCQARDHRMTPDETQFFKQLLIDALVDKWAVNP